MRMFDLIMKKRYGEVLDDNEMVKFWMKRISSI